MKKILYFAALAFLAMGMASCDKDETGTEGGGNGGGQTSQVVTGEYTVETVLDVSTSTFGTSSFTVTAYNGRYLLDKFFGYAGLPFIFTYSGGTLQSEGKILYDGKEMPATGTWLGLADETGEITQAILFASFITQDGGMMQPIIINVDPATGELSDFASNLYLLICPAWLDESGMMQVDPNNGKVKSGFEIGAKIQKAAETASLSSVRHNALRIAPNTMVRATEVNF